MIVIEPSATVKFAAFGFCGPPRRQPKSYPRRLDRGVDPPLSPHPVLLAAQRLVPAFVMVRVDAIGRKNAPLESVAGRPDHGGASCS